VTHAEADDPPPPIQQKARSQFDLDGCKITRADLDRAVALARQDFPPEAVVRINTTRTSGGIATQIFGESVDDLLASVRRATLPGNPDYLDNFTLTISDSVLSPAPRADRYVAIFVNPRFVRVVVEGNDPGWVGGRIWGLRAIFASTRAKWVMSPRKLANSVIASCISLTLVDISILIIIEKISVPVFHHYRVILLLILILCLVLNIAVFVANRYLRHGRRTELQLLGIPKTKRDWILYTFIATVISTLATLAILAVAVITAIGTK
jgi:hypothetical protein